MALTGHPDTLNQCPLLGVKRTLPKRTPMSAFDPKRTELAALAPDVILAVGSAGLPAVLQATQTVPIVFVVVPDPVGSGFATGAQLLDQLIGA